MKKEDRRIRMTKKIIKESLIELMQDYPISKISVKMLCETADINRSTFYSHYADQYDLLKKIQQDAVSEIRHHIANKRFTMDREEVTIPALINILNYAKDNQTMLTILLGENSDSTIQNELLILAREQTPEEFVSPTSPPDHRYLEIYMIAGVVSALREWLNNGCEDDVESMSITLATLLFQGIGGFY